jgi:hypothetical protein
LLGFFFPAQRTPPRSTDVCLSLLDLQELYWLSAQPCSTPSACCQASVVVVAHLASPFLLFFLAVFAVCCVLVRTLQQNGFLSSSALRQMQCAATCGVLRARRSAGREEKQHRKEGSDETTQPVFPFDQMGSVQRVNSTMPSGTSGNCQTPRKTGKARKDKENGWAVKSELTAHTAVACTVDDVESVTAPWHREEAGTQKKEKEVTKLFSPTMYDVNASFARQTSMS